MSGLAKSGRVVSTPPDQSARDRIATDLDTTLLVEAGAGSGKTRALIDRMIGLIAEDRARVSQIAAVTFTRKAAGELRQRFQERLEARRANTEVAAPVRARLEAALEELDGAFMGTIHSFCAGLLRERPIAAGIDPDFRELTGPEQRALARTFWDDWVERRVSEESPLLAGLEAVHLRPADVRPLFDAMTESSDVEFQADAGDEAGGGDASGHDAATVDTSGDEAPASAPFDEAAAVERFRGMLEPPLDAAAPGLPDRRPEKGWDPVQKKVRRALHLRRVGRLYDPAWLFGVISDLCGPSQSKPTYNRWAIEQAARRTRELLDASFAESDGATRPGRALLQRWRTHRYGPAVRFARAGAEAFALHRRRTGRVTFHDLLVLSVRLLRSSPGARTGLGTRYPRILVDEFQDTDPLQAELLFLLTSDPSAADDGPWISLTPRPGSLFLVGDPKQSIYRFRRADIALYEQVRRRIDEVGAVLYLTANFRSVSAIGAVVEGVFGGEGGLFPDEPTAVQAGYAPLATRPEKDDAEHRGVFSYLIPSDMCGRLDTMFGWDAEAVASWIQGRLDQGERRPEDFLILTRRKYELAFFATGLERRGIPVMVSGAGIGAEEELRELRTVLTALVDPANPVLTVAALEGLLFGLDPELLLQHREAGGAFDLRSATRTEGHPEVQAALTTMGRWWEMARRRPADEVLDQIVASTGLMALAASRELGSVRAGALGYALDLIRTTALSENASLAAAAETLEMILEDEDSEAEAPLEPERGGAVRVMNLHKAKGLQAPVVILAAPRKISVRTPDTIVERSPDGRSRGWHQIAESERFTSTIHAAPADWSELADRERLFLDAEEARLLYVAVTRAAEELVVALPDSKKASESAWGGLAPWLGKHAAALEFAPADTPPSEVVSPDLSEMLRREEELTDHRLRLGDPGMTWAPVTALVKGGDPAGDADGMTGLTDDLPAPEMEGRLDARPVDLLAGWSQSEADQAGPGGLAWGSAVHAVLEAAADISGDGLRALARTALLENDRPTRDGEPIELDTLLRLVEGVRQSEIWKRATAAELVLTEHPFAWLRPDGSVVEGVIDLLFREADGWVLIDYKTDRDDDGFAYRLPGYERQVALYREAWEAISGETVSEAGVWRV